MPARTARRAAFALIELIVVIAIIAILATMFLPTLGKAKKQAQQINCVSNFQQIGAALRMYVDDISDWLPPGPCNFRFFDMHVASKLAKTPDHDHD